MLVVIDDDEHHPQIGAHFLEPVKLRDKDVARIHGPGRPPVGPEGAIQEREALIHVAAIPGDEKLAGIRVADDRPGHQDDLVHVLQVLHGDQILQIQQSSARSAAASSPWRIPKKWRRRRSRAGKWWCASPESPRSRSRSDTMVCTRKHQRRRNAGQDQVGHFIIAPVPRRSAPAQAQESEDHLPDFASTARSRSVARSGTSPVNQNSSETVK